MAPEEDNSGDNPIAARSSGQDSAILQTIALLEGEISNISTELRLTPGDFINGFFLIFSVVAGFSGIIYAVVKREPLGLVTAVGFLGTVWSLRNFARGFRKRNELRQRQLEIHIQVIELRRLRRDRNI